MQAEILNKSQERLWDDFVLSHPLGTISQTSNWGKFQEKIPSRGKYWIIALKDHNKIIGGTIIIRHNLAKGYCWLYLSRGPLLDYKSKNLEKNMSALLEKIKEIAETEKAIFLRIDPPLRNDIYKKWPHLKGYYTSRLGFQPQDTLILDLTESEENILAQMKQKGRYNIRIAEKKGVTIRKSDPKNSATFASDLDHFYKILCETTARDKFHGHEKNVYKDMLETLPPPLSFPRKRESTQLPHATLYLAQYAGQTIAGIIVTYYKDTATYYYGASSDAFRNVMAPYLLQWTAIKEAKSKGYKYYDFLGISPPDKFPVMPAGRQGIYLHPPHKFHPWAGVTEFKKKFGGKEISYLPAKEYPFKKAPYLFYRLYKFIKK